MANYQKIYVNKDQSRWVCLDQYGNKDKITLQTRDIDGFQSTIIRTCQFWETVGQHVACQISYKGNRMMVVPGMLLEI